MPILDSMRESVGIRQVYHNGVKLPGCMRLDIVGGDLTVVESTDGVKTYRLDLTGLEARVAALEAMLDGTGTIQVERLAVRYISPLAGTLSIQLPTPPLGFADMITITTNTLDITPVRKMGFFGVAPVGQPVIPNVSTLADTEGEIESVGILRRADP